MADEDANLQSSGDLFIKSVPEFEKELKTRLFWSKKQWVDSGESGTRVNKLVNSLNYWKKKLKPAMVDNSIVFTIFNTQQDVKMDLLQIITAVEELDSSIKVRGFSDFRNPRYLSIYFSNKKERDRIMDLFKIIDNSFVVYLSWALEKNENVITVNVHWIPRNIDLNEIKEALKKYVKCVEEERLSFKLLSGRDMPSGKAVFKAAVNEGVSVEAIPHLLNIAEMEALITIPGRLPLCLNCEVLGHISKKCKLRFCASCNELKLKEHVCLTAAKKLSYAAIVRDKGKEEPNIDLDDWGAAIVIKPQNDMNKQKELLAEKIKTLEQKIDSTGTKPEISNTSKVDLKRKACEILISQERSDNNLNDQDTYSSSEGEDLDIDKSHDSEHGDWGSNIELLMDVENTSITEASYQSAVIDNTVKKKSHKYKKEATSDPQASGVRSNDDLELKTYGNRGRRTRRSDKQEKKFDKLWETRDFVFKD